MVGAIATTLLAGARMPAGATSNMERKVPKATADRVAARQGAGCQKFASLPAEGKVFFLDIPFYRTPLFGPSVSKVTRGVAPAQRRREQCRVFWPSRHKGREEKGVGKEKRESKNAKQF